jgi:hypothetical protein
MSSVLTFSATKGVAVTKITPASLVREGVRLRSSGRCTEITKLTAALLVDWSAQIADEAAPRQALCAARCE